MRMESCALQIASCVFERIGNYFDQGEFLNKTLFGIFRCLHFYRNNTKSKVIPIPIMKTIHTFFANFMICHGSQILLDASNKV